MHRLAVALTLIAPTAALAGGHGTFYDCAAEGLSLTVEIAANDCTVGSDKADKVADDPVTCHLSTPQLRIFTLQSDGAFRYEDTDDDRVWTGICTPR